MSSVPAVVYVHVGSIVTGNVLDGSANQPGSADTLTCTTTPAGVALVEQHGLDWFERLLSSWFTPQRAWTSAPAPTRAAWAATLPDLCAELRDDPNGPAGLGTEAARALASRSSDWLLDAVRRAASIATPSRRDFTLESLAVPTLAVLRILLPLVVDGTLKPVIDRTFSLEQAADAHRYMADRRQFGKLVLVV